MNEIINSKRAVLNLNLLLEGENGENDSLDKVKPKNLVANWSCTQLHRTTSWKGRFWKLVRWVTRTESHSLQITILNTCHVFRENVQNIQKLVKDVNEPGVLGNYWKDRKVESVRADVKKAIQFQKEINKVDSMRLLNLERYIAWANNKTEKVDGKEPTVKALMQFSDELTNQLKVADYKTEKAEFLLKRLKEMGNFCSLEVLYREMLSNYPKSDEELKRRRDQIQEKTLGYNPEDKLGEKTFCPETLIYAPLVALARDFSNRKELSLEELEMFLDDLMLRSATNEIKNNAKLLMDMIQCLCDPERSPTQDIPSSVLNSLRDEYWVKRCDTERTTAQNWIWSEKQERSKTHVVPGYVKASYGSYYIYIPPETYTENYCVFFTKYFHFNKKQDGTERIGVHFEDHYCS